MFNKFLIVMTISALSLYGCGGGDGGGTTTGTDTPTDTSLVFSIFAPEYFDVNYSASYSLVGSDTKGDSYTATQTVTAGAVTEYSGKPVQEIIVDTSIINISTSGPIRLLDKKYFTSEANYSDLRLLASENLLGFSAINTVDYIIPLTATIGEGGTIGEFFRIDSSSFTQSWKLTDGFNGKAKLILTTVPSDTTSSGLYPTTIEKLLISQDGTISGFELIIIDHQNSNTITLKSL